MDTDVKIELSPQEREICLKEIRKKIIRSIYVYEQSQQEDTEYDYKVYIGGLIIYVSSSNNLFNGELVSIIVYLNSILQNDFDKNQFKKIIFECKNYIDYLLKEGDSNGKNN